MTEAAVVARPRRPRRGVVAAVLAASAVAGVAAGAMVASAGDRPTSGPTPSSSSVAATPAPSGTATYPALPQATAALDEDQFVVPRGRANDTRLYLAAVAGGPDPRKLSTPRGEHVNSPTLSSDRRTLIYVDRTTGRLRTMGVDGKDDQQLFDGLPARCDEIGHVSWSRVDQTTLVIRCTSSNGPDRLMVIDLNGTVLRMLDDPHARLDDPVLSPDGRSVAYWAADASTSDGSGSPGGGGIYIRDIAGATSPRLLTRDVAGRDADPAWSPDGSAIAFRRRSSTGNSDVYVVSSNGGDPRRVVGGPAKDEKPLWSPDGRQLMIISNRTADGQPGPTADVYLVDLDGGALEPLGLTAASISTPVWSAR